MPLVLYSLFFSRFTEILFTLKLGRCRDFEILGFLIQKCSLALFFMLLGSFFPPSLWNDFRTICVNFWGIEKLCSLTNCISSHLAQAHMLHKYLIMEVCWIWVPHSSVCAHVGYSVVGVVKLQDFPYLFPGLLPHLCSCVFTEIPLSCSWKATVILRAYCMVC